MRLIMNIDSRNGVHTMVKRNPVEKKIQRKCYVVGLIAFVSALFLAYFLLGNIRKNEQAAATYTAQNTVRRIQSQLDEYVTCSNVLENVIRIAKISIHSSRTGGDSKTYLNNV